MLGFIFSILFSRLRSQFKGFKLQLIYVFQDILSLFILYQTSEAFSHVKTTENSLFGYLLIGELVLRLPTTLIFTPFERMRPWIESGALEYAIGFKGGPKKVFIYESFSFALIDLIRCLGTLSLCALIFSDYINRDLYIRAMIVEITTMPLFLMIGLVMLPLSVFYTWGRMVVGRVIGVMAIFSGGYFPLSFLGESQHVLTHLNPLTIYIDSIRVGLNLESLFILLLLYVFVAGLFFLSSSLLIRKLKSGSCEELKG